MSEVATRLEAVRRCMDLDPPTDGSLDRIARLAATLLATPMAAVSIVEEYRVRFLGTVGLGGITELSNAPGLCASAVLGAGPYVVLDTARDSRTACHSWIREAGVRFYAGAPIVTADGHPLGTVNVLDRRHRRRVTTEQKLLLVGLAETVAWMLDTRAAALTAVRVERARYDAEIAARQSRDSLREALADVAESHRTRMRPDWCQLGGFDECRGAAEVKIADSWGDSAWGCWKHAEEALVNVTPTFVASDSDEGPAAYRSGRLSRRGDAAVNQGFVNGVGEDHPLDRG